MRHCVVQYCTAASPRCGAASHLARRSSVRPQVPGVRWVTKFGVEDVGYGIKELTVTAMVPPDTPTDAVVDAVRGLTNSVKSVDLVVFQKA